MKNLKKDTLVLVVNNYDQAKIVTLGEHKEYRKRISDYDDDNSIFCFIRVATSKDIEELKAEEDWEARQHPDMPPQNDDDSPF